MTRSFRLLLVLVVGCTILATSGTGVVASPPPNVSLVIHNEMNRPLQNPGVNLSWRPPNVGQLTFAGVNLSGKTIAAKSIHTASFGSNFEKSHVWDARIFLFIDGRGIEETFYGSNLWDRDLSLKGQPIRVTWDNSTYTMHLYVR